MLDPFERAEVAAAFGVPETQVDRDHFISHVLVALSTLDAPVTFFGGTALSRTHVNDPAEGARLSEDIDLYGAGRGTLAELLERELPVLIRREFPRAFWDPGLTAVRSVESGQLVSREGLRLRVQVLEHDDFARYPVEARDVLLRYSDLPASVRLTVPTLTAFAAMKVVAWFHRGTARDLYDLAQLARLQALNVSTADLVREVAGISVRPYFFTKAPLDWATQLAHQTGQLTSAEECLSAVRRAFAEALDWDQDTASDQ